MRIALIRHPPPDIAPGICYGRLDPDIRNHGDITTLAAKLAGFSTDFVWTSPARRCRMLAESFTANPIIDPRLQELDFGAWEGLPWDAVPRDQLDRWAADPAAFAPPGGESGTALIARIRAFASELRVHRGHHIVVSHGGPLKILQALLAGREPDLLAAAPPWGSISIFE